jgi:hypothetical protein
MALRTLFPIRSHRRFPAEPAVRFSSPAFAIFFLLCVAVNWPGRLNEDSLEQFIGFQNPTLLGDMHSPLVTYLWSLAAPFVKQPASALIVQAALLSFYAAMLPSPLPRRGAALAAAAAEAAIKLSLVVLAGFVIKDVLLVGLLLAALACLQRAGAPPRSAAWFAAAALLFLLSLVVRPTNFFMMAVAALVIVPLVVRTWRGRGLALAAALALLASSLPVYAVFNAYVVKARKEHAEIQLFLFDGAGISARTGRDLVAELPGWPAGLPDPRRCYTPSEAAIVASWSRCRGSADAGLAVYARGRRHMIAWWLRNIARHPLAYASHRLDYSRNLLDPVGAARGHPVYAAAGADRAGRYLYALNAPSQAPRLDAATRGRLPPGQFLLWQDGLAARSFARLTNLILGFRGTPALALLASALLLGWTWLLHLRGRPPPPLTVPVAASLAAGNFLMHALAGVASQERYLHPTAFCAAFALLVALCHVRASSSRGDDPPQKPQPAARSPAVQTP